MKNRKDLWVLLRSPLSCEINVLFLCCSVLFLNPLATEPCFEQASGGSKGLTRAEVRLLQGSETSVAFGDACWCVPTCLYSSRSEFWILGVGLRGA